MVEFKCPRCGATLVVSVKERPPTKSLEDVKHAFPEDLRKLLSFEDKPDRIIVRPRQFLDSDNFREVASKARDIGGEYISAGKNSRFEITKEK